MTKHVYVYALLALAFYTSCEGQNKITDSLRSTNEIDDWNKRWKIKDDKLPAIHSETASQGVIIQNSLPKGDRHTDSGGKVFGIAIFWTRVINNTANPLELTINFPADSLEIPSSPDSYLKLFLPADTMTLDKVPLYNYGVTGLRSYLDTGLNKPSKLQRTINPKEESLFYIGVLRYQVPDQAPGTRRPGLHQARGGVIRTALVLKEEDLFYRISIDLDSTLIPCGQIVFKN
jgi:hypothetical protein